MDSSAVVSGDPSTIALPSDSCCFAPASTILNHLNLSVTGFLSLKVDVGMIIERAGRLSGSLSGFNPFGKTDTYRSVNRRQCRLNLRVSVPSTTSHPEKAIFFPEGSCNAWASMELLSCAIKFN